MKSTPLLLLFYAVTTIAWLAGIAVCTGHDGYVLDAAFVSVSAVCGYAFRAHQNRKKPASVSLDAGK